MSTLSWRSRGLVVAGLVLGLALPAQATLMGRLEATPGGMDYQAYCHTDLGITWAANANINGLMKECGQHLGDERHDRGGEWLAAADHDAT